MITASKVAERLDAATSDRRLLDHPFYKAWVAGELEEEDLAFYSTQYWRQVEAFPGYLDSVRTKLDGTQAQQIVADNLADERDGDHAGLWLEFGAGVGAPRDVIEGSVAEPETKECVAAFRSGTDERSVAFALGMLYGYESQTPAVAKTKVDGLRTHYGIDGPALEYFELHGELDVEHAGELATAIAEVVQDEASLEEAAAGARAGAEAIWSLLDGVARVREISCN